MERSKRSTKYIKKKSQRPSYWAYCSSRRPTSWSSRWITQLNKLYQVNPRRANKASSTQNGNRKYWTDEQVFSLTLVHRKSKEQRYRGRRQAEMSIEMIWACRKNGWVLYGQKGVDGGSKQRAGTNEMEVRLGEWCKGCLGQQRNERGGCGSMSTDWKKWRALVHMSLNEFHMAIFAWPCVPLDHPPALWWLSHLEGWDVITWGSFDKL